MLHHSTTAAPYHHHSSTPYPSPYGGGSPSTPHAYSYSPSTEKQVGIYYILFPHKHLCKQCFFFNQDSVVKSLPNLVTPAPPQPPHQHYGVGGGGGGGYTPQRPYSPAQHFRATQIPLKINLFPGSSLYEKKNEFYTSPRHGVF